MAAVAAQPTRSGLAIFLAASALAAAAVYLLLRSRVKRDEPAVDDPQPVEPEPPLLEDRFGSLLSAARAAEAEFDEAVSAAEEAAREIDRVAPPNESSETETQAGFGERDREAGSD